MSFALLSRQGARRSSAPPGTAACGLLGFLLLLISLTGCPGGDEVIVPEIRHADPDVHPDADEDDFIDQRTELGG